MSDCPGCATITPTTIAYCGGEYCCPYCLSIYRIRGREAKDSTRKNDDTPPGKKPKPILRRSFLKMAKYGNKRTKVGDRTFDSKGEAARAMELRIMEKAGLIRALEFQVTFPLYGRDGSIVGAYRADYCYTDLATGKDVIEDFKSPATRTPLFLLKKKLMKAQGMDVLETYANGKKRRAE